MNPTLYDILYATLDVLNIKKEDFKRARKSRLSYVVEAKQIVCFVAQHFGYSQQSIADFLGLTHAAILNNQKRAYDFSTIEKGYANKVNAVLEKFERVRKWHIVNGWVARDNEDNTINFFTEKPETFDGIWVSEYSSYSLPKGFFPQLSFDDSPQRCEMTLRLKQYEE